MLSPTVFNQWGEYWASFMGAKVFESLVALMFIGLIWLLFRKHISAQIAYWLFFLVLLKLIIPGPLAVKGDTLLQGARQIPGLLNTGAIESSSLPVEIGETTQNLLPAGSANERVQNSPVSGKHSFSLSFSAVLMLVWALVVAALLLRFLFCQHRTHLLVKRAKPIILEMRFERLLNSIGIDKSTRIVSSAEIPTPAVWGIFRPSLIIPDDMLVKYPSSQLKWIFLHEATHIRRHDNLVCLFQKLIQIIFFFNPVAWIASRLVDQNREFVCDDTALANSHSSRRDCGEAFLGLVMRSNKSPMTSYNVVGGACLSKRQIQKRLIRILDAKRSLKKSFSIGGLSLLVGIAALLLLFSFRSESLASVPDSSLLFPTLQDDFGIIGTPDAVTIPLPGLPRDARPLEMVLIKAGSFIMGSTEKEKSRLSTDWPAHEVVIPQDFYIGKYEVTQAQWEAVAGKHRFYNRGRPNHPAEKVSWRFCQRFIKKLNALGLGIFRLPTEAEWEYACRAGTQTRFFFGNSLDRADEYMWWKGNNETNSTKEVGLKKPNLWGLYDMLGNVNEWCQDRWESPFTILWSNRVFRGGAYSSGAEKCRAAYRDYEQSMDYHYTIGFRLVMDVPENK